MASLTAGHQVTPSLRLLRELGHGGMGRVWVAEHLTLRAEVAVKFLAEETAAIPDAVARFSAEAAAVARIRSPHVAQVFDHGVSSDAGPYIVMELLEGEDLARYLERHGTLSARETCAIVDQVCKALEKAHALGIVHRDIKPANLFVVANPAESSAETFVKVLDFGLAKDGDALGVMTGSHAVFGTPHYLSPEQAESAHSATPQSDLWSLAVVVYECLTGKRPFEADSLMGLCIALHEGRFAAVDVARPDLPAALDEWFVRAFQHEPEDRFRSAAELATSLAVALASQGATRAPLARIMRPIAAVGAVGAAAALLASVFISSPSKATATSAAATVQAPLPSQAPPVDPPSPPASASVPPELRGVPTTPAVRVAPRPSAPLPPVPSSAPVPSSSAKKQSVLDGWD